MKAEEYIFRRIKALLCQFPRLKCTYQYDALAGSHAVLVEPAAYYAMDKALQRSALNMMLEFIRIFPFENLFFTHKSDRLDEEEPMQEFKGLWHDLEAEQIEMEWPRNMQVPSILEKSEKVLPSRTHCQPHKEAVLRMRTMRSRISGSGITCATDRAGSSPEDLVFAENDESNALAS